MPSPSYFRNRFLRNRRSRRNSGRERQGACEEIADRNSGYFLSAACQFNTTVNGASV